MNTKLLDNKAMWPDVFIIVGANYGDEGKGLATDYFTNVLTSENKSVLNVLHNGGAQRAHTVQTPDGIRHIFRTVGSGTFSGADTMLTGAFLINPIELRNELEELKTMGYNPDIYITDHCRITTPWDMMGNQIYTESKSLDKQQGTCGMGIWETILRNNSIRFTIQDLFIALNSKDGFESFIRKKLYTIRKYYIDHRLEFHLVPEEWQKLFMSEEIVTNFIEDLKWMLLDTQINFAPSLFLGSTQPVWNPWSHYDSIIFENGQGMLIDGDLTTEVEFNTPSHTTLTNPFYITKQWARQEGCTFGHLTNVFVTRTYLTRHGRGSMINECDVSYLETRSRIFDLTNIPNQWQGCLRYGKFDYMSIYGDTNSLFNRISNEFDKHDISEDIFTDYENALFITHADEVKVDGAFQYLLDNNSICDSCYISNGPTKDNVYYCKPGTIEIEEDDEENK